MEHNEEYVRKIVEEVLKTNEGKYSTVFGGVLTNKPEHMTHLRGNTLVFKDHPVIKYRGALDYLESKIICTQVIADKKGY
ncbi:MAG: cobalamin adenosyltransferase, partial [Clostridia bacterium]|nr:cobalamin adenosyltransferase [Clostridia bacterium]